MLQEGLGEPEVVYVKRSDLPNDKVKRDVSVFGGAGGLGANCKDDSDRCAVLGPLALQMLDVTTRYAKPTAGNSCVLVGLF